MPLDVTTRPQIQEYPSWTNEELRMRLATVVNQLVHLYQDYYRMQGDETRSKADAWLNSNEQTVTGRSRDVELATYHITSSILETRGSIEALKEERQFILILLGK